MNFSKTTEYALRIMSYMAIDEEKLYTAKDIYKDLQIPQRYLSKLLTKLSKSGLMKSIQGKHGGYKLSKKLSEISLLDIVNAAGEETMHTTSCFFGFDTCALQKQCSMHDIWVDIQTQIIEVLSSNTLDDIKETGPEHFIKIVSQQQATK